LTVCNTAYGDFWNRVIKQSFTFLLDPVSQFNCRNTAEIKSKTVSSWQCETRYEFNM